MVGAQLAGGLKDYSQEAAMNRQMSAKQGCFTFEPMAWVFCMTAPSPWVWEHHALFNKETSPLDRGPQSGNT